MNILVTDQSDNPISPDQLSGLALWNDTIGHICATAMGRVQQQNLNASEISKDSK